MRARPTLAAAIAAFGLLCGALGAQEAGGPERLRIRGADLRLPHEMLDAEVGLVGIEQAGNDFRSRTPALQRTARRAAEVPAEELRARRLALYAGEAPLSARSDDGGLEPSAEPEERAVPAGPGIGVLLAFLLLGIGCLCGGLMAWRGVSARRASAAAARRDRGRSSGRPRRRR